MAQRTHIVSDAFWQNPIFNFTILLFNHFRPFLSLSFFFHIKTLFNYTFPISHPTGSHKLGLATVLFLFSPPLFLSFFSFILS